MKPGELTLRIGEQTRKFSFDPIARQNLSRELKTIPLKYVQEADPEVFNSIAAYFGVQGKIKKDKVFTTNDTAKWVAGEVLDADGKELDQIELAVEFLYSLARGKTGKDAETDLRRLDIMFPDHGDSDDDDEEGDAKEGEGFSSDG